MKYLDDYLAKNPGKYTGHFIDDLNNQSIGVNIFIATSKFDSIDSNDKNLKRVYTSSMFFLNQDGFK